MTFTVSYSGAYCEDPKRLIGVVLQFLEEVAKDPKRARQLRIAARQGKITGVKQEIDEPWGGEPDAHVKSKPK
ncbi:hypothetical protein [Candidatus Manganitrophus noduliformans]|uniref:Uncharacterized protein n=1 Tax=Candidatus Manganitrophus noduliformans TaxID=2606439 RepID=A0A7X6DMC6_9BACT|nr:hypothetical protein [Candidatus Manganitrophus noduliformans]NKE69882.1 hypothetical protein [Candidatus Manganitrophus noduliformans]